MLIMDIAGNIKPNNTTTLLNPFITVGTNKSQYVVNKICAELVRIGRFKRVNMDFLQVGHTKNKADKLFATIAKALLELDYFNMQ